MGKLIWILLFAMMSVSSVAQHTCRLCNRHNGCYIPPVYTDVKDSICFALFDSALSDYSSHFGENMEILRCNYSSVLFRQKVMQTFLDSSQIKKGHLSGYLVIDEEGKVNSVRISKANKSFSQRKQSAVSRTLSSFSFVPAHEHNVSRQDFWKFEIDFDALFRTGIKTYNVNEVKDSQDENTTIGIFWKKTALIDVSHIDEYIYNAYRENPKLCLSFFMDGIKSNKYPLWIKAIFASYLPKEEMNKQLSVLQTQSVQASEIDKLLFLQELIIIHKLRKSI